MHTNFIAIASSKGGVGKTVTAINLASALNKFGRNIVLVDGNYTKPNVGLMLGITKVDATLHHTLRGEEKIEDAVYVHPSGIQVIPGSIIYEDLHQDHVKKIEDAISPLRGKCEAVILDCGPGYSQETIDILNISDSVLLVTNPELTSITDTLRTKKLCKDKGINILGIVITHTKHDDTHIELYDIETIIGEKVIGEIPFDENVPQSIHKKYPVVDSAENSKAAIAYKKLAANIIGEKYEDTIDEGIFNYILKRLGFKD